MSGAYAHAREYLDDVIALVTRLLEREACQRRAASEAELRALAELDVELVRRDDELTARCEASSAERLPIEHLRDRFDLSPTEMRVIAVLCALEISGDVRRVAAGFLDHRAAAATVELVETLVYRGVHRATAALELAPDGRLFRARIAVLGDPALPWLVRPIRLAPRVLELALGRLRLDLEVAAVASLVEHPARGDDLLLDPGTRALVVDTLAHGGTPLVIGPRGAGRVSLVLAAAHATGVPALVVRAAALPRDPAALAEVLQTAGREAILFGALLVLQGLDVLTGDHDRGQPDLLPVVAGVLGGYPGMLALTAERAIWPSGSARGVVVAMLGVPSEAERVVLWSRHLGAENGDLPARAAERYRVTGGVIAAAADAARMRARARGEAVALDDVRVGIRGELDRELSTLGQRVDWHQTWDDLVVSDDVAAELDEMIARLRHRRRVLDDWGFARKVGKGIGISALFSGPPGTGKTMVAGLIAAELELDLYQIDVSRMVSKWVGETEKNLARLFDAAASGHAVLLFDEADSLFAKRTEVRSSNDRYANLEVNYLLQRMEAFDGITILTTNLETSVDEAFRRRLAFRIQFPVPEVEERLRLWHAMLPAEAAVQPDLDLRSLAQRFEMTGGYIRNAVLRAAYLAAAEDAPIGMRHLRRAATLEYGAMGMIVHSSL